MKTIKSFGNLVLQANYSSASISMDRYLLSKVPRIVALQGTTPARTIKEEINEAIQRMQIAISDSYDIITVFSLYWISDDTGGMEDSALFINTISKLPNVQTQEEILPNNARLFGLGTKVTKAAESIAGRRKLFILHYAGHAMPGSTPDSLIIIPNSTDEHDGPQLNLSVIKNELKRMSTVSVGLDILLVVDSCCAAIAGRGGAVGARVELVASTARNGTSKSRVDGLTFTQHWCKSFTTLLEAGKPFTCDDVIKHINAGPELDQFSKVFILLEGWNLPITFRPHPGPIEAPAVTFPTVITAFHVKEDCDSIDLEHLTDDLNKASVPITVLAVLPASGTLLLLRMPIYLQELLNLPRVALMTID